MKPELDKQLCEKYPEIFQDRNASMYETLMHGGFSCDDGWFVLIDNLCEELSKTTPIPVAMQVKEKYGTLRFYLKRSTDEHQEIVGKYEKLSAHVCEQCGAEGKLRTNKPWIRTLCETHA